MTNEDKTQESVNEMQDEIYEMNMINSIVQRIKDYLITERITLENFGHFFEVDKSERRTVELKNRIRAIFGTALNSEEIDKFVSTVSSKSSQEEYFNLRFMISYLKSSFDKKRASSRKSSFTSKSPSLILRDDGINTLIVNKKISKYVSFFEDVLIEENLSYVELDKTSEDISEGLVNLFRDPESYKVEINTFVKRLKKKKFKKYLFKILNYLLKETQKLANGDHVFKLKKKNIHLRSIQNPLAKLQSIYCQDEILTFCFSQIADSNDYQTLTECLDTFISLLDGANRDVQKAILNFLQKDYSTPYVFAFFRVQLRQTLEIFKAITEPKENGSNRLPNEDSNDLNSNEQAKLQIKLTNKAVQLLRLFCENCYTDFQNFLRSQTSDSKRKIVSSNMLTELSNFVIDLHLSDPEIFSEPMVTDLLNTFFTTLISMCIGPCQDNQVVLINQKHLITFFNNIITRSFDFSTSFETEMRYVEVLGFVIKVLLALVEENDNKLAVDSLIMQLEIESLYKHLDDIYFHKISSRNTNILRQGRKCDMRPGCSLAYCKQNYLTDFDIICIDLAFNIYILLTIFSEVFSNPKVESFSRIPITQEEKEIYDKLEQDYTRFKSRKRSLRNPSFSKKFSLRPKKSSRIFPSSSLKAFPSMGGSGNGSRTDLDDERNFLRTQFTLTPKNSILPGDDDEDEPRLRRTNSKIDSRTTLISKDTRRDDKTPTLVRLDLVENDNPEKKEFKKYFTLKQKMELTKIHKFFSRQVHTVEILKNDKISKVFFRIPPECDFMSYYIKDHVIFKANRNTDIERLENLFDNIPKYWKELKYLQKISKYRLIDIFSHASRIGKDINFYLMLTINILLLTFQYNSISDEVEYANSSIESAILILGVIHMTFSGCLCISVALERYPIAAHESTMTHQKALKNSLKSDVSVYKSSEGVYSKLSNYIILKKTLIFSKYPPPEIMIRMIRIISDFEIFYCLFYTCCSIISLASNPFAYSLLILDAIKRSTSMQLLVKSLFRNMKEIFLLVVLTFILANFLTIIGFVGIRDTFYNNSCNSLISCWSAVFLRMTSVKQDVTISLEDDHYWTSWTYDMLIYILFSVVMLRLFLGIIINTFSEIRGEKIKMEGDMNSKCFICSLSRNDFETKGNGWIEHIFNEHNVYSYINYIIHAQKKDSAECNGIELYVKKKIEANDISFFPHNRASALRK